MWKDVSLRDLAIPVAVVLLAGLCYWAVRAFRKPATMGQPPSPTVSGKEDKPLISLVLLLRMPRTLESNQLAQTFSEALGTDMSGKEPNAMEFVVGESPMFIAKTGGYVFSVNDFARPYVPDVQGQAGKIKDVRLPRALAGHKAWLSVDLLAGPEGADPNSAYPLIGKMIAALAGDDCTGVFAPQTGQLKEYGEFLKKELAGGDPMGAMGTVPIIQVPDEDPQMQAAIEEARRRWPEFETAFRKSQGSHFSVKAPFKTGDGGAEHIWIEVASVEGEIVRGALGNEPGNIPNLKLGDSVQVNAKDISDWIYMRGKEMVGGFSVKLLQERAKAQ